MSIFTIYITDCPRWGRGWKRDGERCCSPNSILLGCPKRVQHPSRSAELWEQCHNPNPSLCPLRPSQNRDRRIYGCTFSMTPRVVNFPRQTQRGSAGGAASPHLFWNSGMLKSLSLAWTWSRTSTDPLGEKPGPMSKNGL